MRVIQMQKSAHPNNLKLCRFYAQYRRPTTVIPVKTDELREQFLTPHESCSPAFSVLRKVLMERTRHLNVLNIDSAVIGLMTGSGDNLTNAKKYLQYLHHKQETPSKTFLGKLLKLYNQTAKARKLRKEELKEISTIYTELRKDCEVLDSSLCENLIYGISLTDKWKEGIPLLEEAKISAIPSTGCYSALATRAFENEEDFHLGWRILEEMIEAKRQPLCEVFISFFNTAARTVNFKELMEQMFGFLGANDLQVSRDVILVLRSRLTEKSVKNLVTMISEKGSCDICSAKLSSLQLTDYEFNKLQKHFLQKVLIRDDVFQKSTPHEVNLFLNVMKRSGKYDCVIDGLNVAYSSGTNQGPHVYSAILASVVKYFKEKDKRVLVIGRKHMLQWKTPSMLFVKRHSDIFYTSNLSQDDPFLLYAALHSGINTDFLSRDLMRSHSYLLDDELKGIFKRWQQVHQYSLVTASGGNNRDKVIVNRPTSYCTFAHKVKESTWHIPFREKYSSNPAESFESPENWLCVRLE